MTMEATYRYNFTFLLTSLQKRYRQWIGNLQLTIINLSIVILETFLEIILRLFYGVKLNEKK